ncbi:MAG TPA: hypothetical protein PKA05_08075 [Roseiflexaceae bacterium]|nr:hypothetical protein [Roseiflexaceae bacterium]HMP40320.1 hypothetical protein [Roseiflexaceae bacterium]
MLAIPLGLRLTFVGLTLMVMSVGLIGATSAPTPLPARRIASAALWESRPAPNYRMVVQVMINGRNCLQEVEVQHAQRRLLHDTCGTSWVSALTIDRLFELSERLERAPECFPSAANCVCRRMRVGEVTYDPALGYPGSVSWRRELRPNFEHPDYWVRLWNTRTLPACTASSRPLSMTVVSMTLLK